MIPNLVLNFQMTTDFPPTLQNDSICLDEKAKQIIKGNW
jgi:hypothetical protein